MEERELGETVMGVEREMEVYVGVKAVVARVGGVGRGKDGGGVGGDDRSGEQ